MTLYARILLLIIRPALDLHAERTTSARRISDSIRRGKNFEKQVRAAMAGETGDDCLGRFAAARHVPTGE